MPKAQRRPCPCGSPSPHRAMSPTSGPPPSRSWRNSNTPPLLRGRITETPQASIVQGLGRPSGCDIVIVALWAHMGTPLPADWRKSDGSPYLSGTEWAYRDAVRRPHSSLRTPPSWRSIGNGSRSRSSSRASACPTARSSAATTATPPPRTYAGSSTSICGSRSGGDWTPGPPHRRDHRPPRRRNPAPPALWKGSPFPGLRALRPDDAPIFCGRDRETQELLRRVTDGETRFIAGVGASGSGKSSLAAAGLLPALLGHTAKAPWR